jgi:hypothetical protein
MRKNKSERNAFAGKRNFAALIAGAAGAFSHFGLFKFTSKKRL